MTITFPRDFPTVSAPRRIRPRPSVVVAMTQAPYSRKQQIQEFGGHRWEWEIEFGPMNPSIGQAMEAFFTSLRGPVGTFLIGNPKKATPQGAAQLGAGTPLVDGASQLGMELDFTTTGLGSVADYLLAGDQFSLGTGSNRRLYQLTADCDLVADAGTLEFWPPLRVSPGDNDPIDLSSPSGIFRLASVFEGADIDSAGNYDLGTLAIIEALEV